MTDTVGVVSFLEILIGAGLLVVAGLLWGFRDRRGGRPSIVLSLAGAGWAISAGVASLNADPWVTLSSQLAAYWFAGLLALSWLYVALEYAGVESRHHPVVLAAVYGLLVADAAALATSSVHGLYIVDATMTAAGLLDPTPGPLLLLFSAAKTVAVLVGVAAMTFRDIPRHGAVRRQTVAVTASAIPPLAGALAELFDLLSIPGLDVGVIGVGIGALILLWALFYADLLELQPVARTTLLDNVADALVVLDVDDRVLLANGQAAALLDLSSQPVGQPFEDVFSPPGAARESGSRVPGQFDFSATVAGDRRHFETTYTPLVERERSWLGRRAGTPTSVGTMVTFHDVTERIERERTIEAQNRRLDDFATVVSHDLRNPLAVAQAWLSEAQRGTDSEELAHVERAHGRMEHLIEDLLTLARTDGPVEHPVPVALENVVEEAWADLETGRATLRNEASITLFADPRRLSRLVANLLGNAVEHGGAGVTVSVGALTDGFYVADDGPGIPVGARERVFEWGHSDTTSGTGFGLAIVQRVAEAHGWSVRLTDTPGGGARFEVTGGEVAR